MTRNRKIYEIFKKIKTVACCLKGEFYHFKPLSCSTWVFFYEAVFDNKLITIIV